MASQQSLPDFVAQLDSAGFLVRISDEKRVDEIPSIFEANPTKAVLIEKIKDCDFWKKICKWTEHADRE